jgi:alkylated DNA repair dioxygenase AlkB
MHGGSVVRVFRDLLDTANADKLFTELSEQKFTSPLIRTPAGKKVPIPRGQAAFGSGSYRYSGLTVFPLPWSTAPLLENLKNDLETLTGQRLDYALVNRYFGSSRVKSPGAKFSSIGYHSDDERDLQAGSSIISFSLGAERKFRLRRKCTKRNSVAKETQRSDGVHEIPAGHNVLLIMGGSCQKYYEHCVPKEPKVYGDRINITFRTLDR